MKQIEQTKSADFSALHWINGFETLGDVLMSYMNRPFAFVGLFGWNEDGGGGGVLDPFANSALISSRRRRLCFALVRIASLPGAVGAVIIRLDTMLQSKYIVCSIGKKTWETEV